MVFKFLNGTIRQQEVGKALLHNQKYYFATYEKTYNFDWKKKMKYRTTILVGIRVTYSFYKLSHQVKYLQCSELFAIDKSLVNMVFHKFVCVIKKCLEVKYGGLEKMI
jgi:hypothetical protein